MADPAPETPSREELAAVLALVRACGLPTEGVSEGFPGAYAVVRDAGGAVVAVAGLEAHAECGLLRSVAVGPARRGAGLGARLVEDRVRRARELGLDAVYLLTQTAADYFRALGFEDAPRDGAPAALRASSEFSSVCPSSAVCLARRIR